MLVGAKCPAGSERPAREIWVVPRDSSSRPIVDGRFLFVDHGMQSLATLRRSLETSDSDPFFGGTNAR